VMTGVAFVLFTNYMITDPGTTPMAGRAQFMFGASVATPIMDATGETVPRALWRRFGTRGYRGARGVQ